MVLIKRYSNRKLYNTETRSYITLDEIAEMVQLGTDVRVVDHLTGTDMTASTMTQVLARQEKQGSGMIPQALLERMVQLSGLTLYSMRESMKAFLDPAAYMANDIQRRFDYLQASGRITPEDREKYSALLLDSEVDPIFIKTEEDEAGATMEELQSLLDQIDALEREINQLENN